MLGNRYECNNCGSKFRDTTADECPICGSKDFSIIAKEVRID